MRTLAALPTGGSAFCGALEEGMGDVFVSVQTKILKNEGGCRTRGIAANIRRGKFLNIGEDIKMAALKVSQSGMVVRQMLTKTSLEQH